MKVTLEAGYKDFYTLNDIARAKSVIAQVKDDGETAKSWAEYAVREALRDTGDYLAEVLKAEATTAKNCRANNCYENDSLNMDVWISATAKTTFGYIEVGAYLTDIWQTGGDYEYRNNMFISYYKFDKDFWNRF